MMSLIHIDFLEFIKTGRFDCIKLGQKKDYILNNFKNPDSVWNDTSENSIWLYGNIEFHFAENELYMIFSDHFNHEKLNAGEHISIDRWIFERPRRLSLKNVIQELNTHSIDFHKNTTKLNIELKLNSGVILYFENHKDITDLDPNQYHLIAFSFKEN